MRTFDIELHGVQPSNDKLDDRDLATLITVMLRAHHNIHVNSVKVTERKD